MPQERFIFSMRAKNLVLTIAYGEHYQKLGEITHPSIKSYAEKIGADFLCINERKISATSIHWEKFQIYDLLNIYYRIIFIDTDIIIRDDAPNLFNIISENQLGSFNEAPFTSRSKELLIDCCKVYEVKLDSWDGCYYNSGVMVVSRAHKFLFEKPEKEYCSFYEQTYLNMKIADLVNKKDIEVKNLDYKFNRMSCLDSILGEDRHASYFIHYAGYPNPGFLYELIPEDLKKWELMKGEYKFKRHIAILVNGGLGDQVAAEPAVRYFIENVYPNEDVVVGTHWPRIFKHLNVPVYQHGESVLKSDTPYYMVNTIPSPDSLQWAIVSHLMCHTVDYSSMALMKRTLPLSDRSIKLQVNGEIKSVKKITGDIDLPNSILVHPGRHWQSKTLPTEYWQKIINGLAHGSRKVIIIGKEDGDRGTVPVSCPDNALDLRNLLGIGDLIALIKEAGILVSNDSAPVHIAGAFDNWIVLLPTCKHPDYILPYRNGSPYYKAVALYKDLPFNYCDSAPINLYGSSAEYAVGDWDKYLLSPEEIVKQVNEIKLEIMFIDQEAKIING